MKKKSLTLLVSSIALLSTLAGCSSGGGNTGDSKITIEVWEDQSNISMLQSVANDFIANYKENYPLAPEIEIKFTEQSEKSAIEKLTTVASTGNGADVLAITHDTIPNGVKAGLIDEVYYGAELEERVSDNALSAATYNGKIYGYPIVSESMVLMYDKTKLSASDVVSFDTIKASGKKVALDLQNDGGYYSFGFCSDSILFGEDGKDKNSVNIGTTQSVANWVYFINNDKDAVASATPEAAVSLLEVGTVAGIISTPFIYNDVVNVLGADNVGIAVLPQINGVSERPLSGYKCYAVNKYSKHPELAQALANYLTQDSAQEIRMYQRSYLPVAKTYTADMNDMLEGSAVLQGFKASLDQSIPMPNIDEMTNFWKPMNNAVNALWNATSATTESVKAILDEVTSTLKK